MILIAALLHKECIVFTIHNSINHVGLASCDGQVMAKIYPVSNVGYIFDNLFLTSMKYSLNWGDGICCGWFIAALVLWKTLNWKILKWFKRHLCFSGAFCIWSLKLHYVMRCEVRQDGGKDPICYKIQNYRCIIKLSHI